MTLRERVKALEATVSDFLGIDDWSDEMIAPAELVQRARGLVPGSPPHRNPTTPPSSVEAQRLGGSYITQRETVIDLDSELQWTHTLPGRMSHKDATAAVAKLNQDKHQGFSDWRVPEVRELLTLVDYTRCEPAINVDYFPDTKSDWYWTATPAAGYEGASWDVIFSYGYSYRFNHNSTGFVRAVRGPVARPGQ